MRIKRFVIKNFKSFEEVTLEFNPDVNILTGKNNSGKTTVLEALALWHECFSRKMVQAKRKEKNYHSGDWILGPTYNRYFPFEQINSIRSPSLEDIFYKRDKRRTIGLSCTFEDQDQGEMVVDFQIGQSGANYDTNLQGFTEYNFTKFNRYFQQLPNAIGLYYASPVSAIQQVEGFVTEPQLRDAILRRESVLMLRNRLYKLLLSTDIARQEEFKENLAYLLYNNEQRIELLTKSNIQRDTRVLINYKIGSDNIEKDIALLGSGSLQAIEILLNLYQPGEVPKDLNLVLLDEPDSHIHRDMQQRLMNFLTRFAGRTNTQIFLSTHNESLIRSAAHFHLFHLEGTGKAHIKSIDKGQISKIQPRFKGIYQSEINPIIRSIGSATGLDFINTMEADRIIFVEGEDDARILSLLLRQQVANRKKYMFWVLGGISEVFKHIQAYQVVFSAIRNNKPLWEKAVLVFDKDYLTDAHTQIFIHQLKERLGLEAFAWSSYTLESTVCTDLEKLSGLMKLWIKDQKNIEVDKASILDRLEKEYAEMYELIRQRYGSPKFIEGICYNYQNIREKTENIFGKTIIKQNDIQLTPLITTYLQECLDAGNYFKLMTKDDVGLVLNKVAEDYGLTFSIETDFFDLIRLVNKSLWLEEWDFINRL